MEGQEPVKEKRIPLSGAERQRRWRERHPEKHRESLNKWRREYQRKKRGIRGRKTPLQLRARVKLYALKKDLPFEIPADYFEVRQGEICFFCGLKLDFVRVIMNQTEKGYTEDNLLRLCELCYHLVRIWRYRCLEPSEKRSYAHFLIFLRDHIHGARERFNARMDEKQADATAERAEGAERLIPSCSVTSSEMRSGQSESLPSGSVSNA